MRTIRSISSRASLCVLATVAATSSAWAAVGSDTSPLTEAVTVVGVRAHQAAFQAAADANGGTREASSPGFDDSVDYVEGQMMSAGYDVTIQEFGYPFFQEQEVAELEQISPNPTTYEYFGLAGFATMTYSGSGDVTAIAEGVDLLLPPAVDANTSTSGCEAGDFDGFTSGNIAIIQRGSCSFAVKAQNAVTAGAVGVVIFNEGQPGRQDNFVGTLGSPDFTVPVVGSAFSLGEVLATGDVKIRMSVNATSEI